MAKSEAGQFGPLTRATNPLVLLHVEGGLALAAALILYARTGGNWLLFALLLLAPDLSALGYLAGPRIGAICYNLVHTYLGPAILGGAGLLTGQSLPVSLALIWGAHIGMDRLLGFGLKYPDAFQHTHLTPPGARPAEEPAAARVRRGRSQST